MPIPDTTDVGTLIRFFKKDKPEWAHNRQVAAAISVAQRNRAAQSMDKEAGWLVRGALKAAPAVWRFISAPFRAVKTGRTTLGGVARDMSKGVATGGPNTAHAFVQKHPILANMYYHTARYPYAWRSNWRSLEDRSRRKLMRRLAVGAGAYAGGNAIIGATVDAGNDWVANQPTDEAAGRSRLPVVGAVQEGYNTGNWGRVGNIAMGAVEQQNPVNFLSRANDAWDTGNAIYNRYSGNSVQ